MRQNIGDVIMAAHNGLHEKLGRTARSRSSDPTVADNRLQPFISLDKGWACDDSGDQAVDCADADKVFIPRATQDEIKLLVGERRLLHHAAAFAGCAKQSGFQFHANSSFSRSFVVRPETIRSNTSVK